MSDSSFYEERTVNVAIPTTEDYTVVLYRKPAPTGDPMSPIAWAAVPVDQLHEFQTELMDAIRERRVFQPLEDRTAMRSKTNPMPPREQPPVAGVADFAKYRDRRRGSDDEQFDPYDPMI